jgi:hypothetical protein
MNGLDSLTGMPLSLKSTSLYALFAVNTYQTRTSTLNVLKTPMGVILRTNHAMSLTTLKFSLQMKSQRQKYTESEDIGSVGHRCEGIVLVHLISKGAETVAFLLVIQASTMVEAMK